MIVGAYEGGLLPAWTVETVAAVLVLSGNDPDFVVYPAELGPVGAALLVGIGLGTLGFGIGRLLGAAWTRREGVPA